MTKYNKTQLHIDKAAERGILHRDYLAHSLRWTHVMKFAKTGQRILDVGCGINTPLAWTFYSNKYSPEEYVGVDIRGIETTLTTFPFKNALISNFDVTDYRAWEHLGPLGRFNIVVCFEVLEHMEKVDGLKLLENLSMCEKSAHIFISTPCFNGSAAANHIYEWEYDELRNVLSQMFTIEAAYGTFASQRDILPHLSAGEAEVFETLKAYYDSNLLSILLAPNHPAHSRNCIWRLRTL